MEVLLTKEIAGLGKEGEKVNVARGYARNFLLPQGFAVGVSPANLKKIIAEKKLNEQKEAKSVKDAQEFIKKLGGVSCTISVKTGESGKMFGSVTSEDIVQVMKKEGIELDRKDILLSEPIKELGVFNVEVKVYPRLKGKIRVWVVKESEV
ncbi:50S ribosomal protein L9 [bacterium]|nr:50S ribosomal protein L9 [bacterium]